MLAVILVTFEIAVNRRRTGTLVRRSPPCYSPKPTLELLAKTAIRQEQHADLRRPCVDDTAIAFLSARLLLEVDLLINVALLKLGHYL